jgi:hypothetical protein
MFLGIKPKGSKYPRGAIAPGRPKAGLDASGTHPLIGATTGAAGAAGFSGAAVSTADSVLTGSDIRRTVFAEEDELGANAAAVAAVAAKKARDNFIVLYFCISNSENEIMTKDRALSIRFVRAKMMEM